MRGVVMLVNKFPPVPAGGAERQAERLSAYLGAQQVPVWVITRSAPGLPRSEQQQWYRVERVPQPGVGKLKTITFMMSAAVSLIRNRNAYDILHAHLAFAPALVAALIARLLKKLVVVKYGTSGPYGDVRISQRTVRGRLRLRLLRQWTHMSVALDEEMEHELLEAGYPRERVIRMDNGIDHTAFIGIRSPAAKVALGLEGRTVAIYTGRLVAQKALHVLIAAFQEARIRCPKLHLILLGQGPERANLERLADELGVTDHITFAGNVQDVRPYLSAADMFVLPSEGEGISNAMLEAMAAGLACIATSVGGSAEVLDHGACGRLVAPGHAQQLAEAMAELALNQDTATALGNAAALRIQKRYSLSVVGEKYRRLYADLSNGAQYSALVDHLQSE